MSSIKRTIKKIKTIFKPKPNHDNPNYTTPEVVSSPSR